MENLLEGRRRDCCGLIREELRTGGEAQELYLELLWPAMEQVEQMYREDQIDSVVEHMATRINRMLVDQIQRDLPQTEPNGRTILIACAQGQSEELGAQMCADLFEHDGWEVYFVGGGVPNDEILGLIGRLEPQILLVYGMTPQGVPQTRQLIDLIREVGVCPTMNIMITGGVFNRAEDLWKEINADLYAPQVRDALDVAGQALPRVPDVRIPGAPKKRRRRRPPLLSQAGSRAACS
jgi:methanogenic corrinoid protein MtbC1